MVAAVDLIKLDPAGPRSALAQRGDRTAESLDSIDNSVLRVRDRGRISSAHTARSEDLSDGTADCLCLELIMMGYFFPR